MGSKMMLISELARRVGRSVDTIKRWEEDGLLTPRRDTRGRRVFNEKHVERCLQLAELALLAQRRSEKLKSLFEHAPAQLSLLLSPETEKLAG